MRVSKLQTYGGNYITRGKYIQVFYEKNSQKPEKYASACVLGANKYTGTIAGKKLYHVITEFISA